MSQRRRNLDALSCYRDATEPDGYAQLALTKPHLAAAARVPDINRQLQPMRSTKKRSMGPPPSKRGRLEQPTEESSSKQIQQIQQINLNDGDESISDIDLLAFAEANSPAWRAAATQKQPPPLIDLPQDDDDDDVPGPSNAYGLIQTEKRCYFDDMPTEIIEMILAPLPMLDLLFVVNRVSRRLHEMISKDNFLVWKKLYHKYRYMEKCPEVRDKIDAILAIDGMCEPSTNLVASLLFVHRNFHKTLSPSQYRELFSRLAYDPLFTAARCFVDEQVWPQLQQKPSTWVYLCATLLLTEDALSAVALLRRLVQSPTVLEAGQVVECCYLLALLLLIAQRTLSTSYVPSATTAAFVPAGIAASSDDRVPTVFSRRWHYKIASALYFFENGGGKSYTDLRMKTPAKAKSGQMSMHQFVQKATDGPKNSLTHEQFRIVHTELTPRDCVRIIAFAGTGKTTTLLEYVRARPNKFFLVLMFNKDVSEEASKRFPPNSSCMTTHSLAYHHMVTDYDGSSVMLGAKYRSKLGFNLKTTDAVKVLPKVTGYNLFVRAKHAISTLENFMYSTDRQITSEHAPMWDRDEKNGERAISASDKKQYVADARHLWNKMKDPRSTEVRMLHDGYMKLYQLDNPTIVRPNGEPYDAILIDEAQDMNPATLDIICKQTRSPRMFVGDPNQQIYSFRGAINAFNAIKEATTKTFYLTQSFRFGPEIAFIGNCWLDIVKDESSKMLIGCEKRSRVDGEKHKSGPICIIARLNATIFDHAATIATKMQNKRLSIVGGLQKFDLDEMLDLYQLMLPEVERSELKSNFLRAFNFSSLHAVLAHAKKVFDNELEAKVALVRHYGPRIPGIVARIRECHVSNLRDASYALTTAHKAKGLEFDTVLLANDFRTLEEMRHERMESERRGIGTSDEFNLLYVALTRAKHSLIMNRCLMSFLKKQVNDNLLLVGTSKKARELPGREENEHPHQCDHCNSPFASDNALTLIRPQMKEPCDLNELKVKATAWCGACVVDSEKRLLCLRVPVPPLQPTMQINPSLPAFQAKNDCNRQWIKPFFEKYVA